ncbi:MAG TPA: hypothetical protein VFC72_03115 [Corynebacterium sp.]|nr:hypothetical protein [Corynebacterium sp.]
MIQFVIGAAAGYVMGTRAGRKRFHQIKDGYQAVINSPMTKSVLASTRKAIADKLDPQPRMREVKNLNQDSRVEGQEILERDEE